MARMRMLCKILKISDPERKSKLKIYLPYITQAPITLSGASTPGPEKGEKIAVVCRHTRTAVQPSQDGKHGRDFVPSRQG